MSTTAPQQPTGGETPQPAPVIPHSPSADDHSDLVYRTSVFSADDLRRAVVRIAHEIVERNHGTDTLVLVGLLTRGAVLARRVADAITSFEGTEVPVGALDIAFHRDDAQLRPLSHVGVTHIPVDIAGRTVVLVDDVLMTGRTIRAALDALAGFGRASAIQLAVLIDRGGRELPIRADFVGKNLPTQLAEDVRVRLSESDETSDSVELWGPRREDAPGHTDDTPDAKSANEGGAK